MNDFLYLVPVALALGVGGLAVFMWSLRSGQYEDLDGAAERILFDEDAPLAERGEPSPDRVVTERRGVAGSRPPPRQHG
jgi:cbb3-type cytochrome oxidase maturation protein